jgi:FkbM family methyltransferase
MSNFAALPYRIYFAVKGLGATSELHRSSFVARALRRVGSLIERHVLPNTHIWVKAQAGLSEGMWMRLHLPDETRHWRGEHEPEVQNAILPSVQPGGVFYDVGSHVGTIALGAARLVGEQGRVVAFDGDPDNVAALLESSLRNHLEACLVVVHAAVWSYTARQGIPFRRGGIRRSQGGVEMDGQHPVVGTGEIMSVPAITLDDFVAGGGAVPQVIKIDVEGGEYEVLCGGTNLFTSHRPLIIVEVHHQKAADQIGDWLHKYRYYAQWNIPQESFPRCLFAWPTEYDGARWMRDTSDFSRHC